MRRRLYVVVCLTLFAVVMYGYHELLKAVIYGTPLWFGIIFGLAVTALMIGIGFWMERRQRSR